MTGAEYTFLAAGVFIGALIVAIFDGIRQWAMHEELLDLTRSLFDSKEQVKHLEGLIYPTYIEGLDDSLMVTRKRSKLYDKYVELVEPGTEVLDLKDAEQRWAGDDA